ncbi:SunS family peptide S-glycosyltransferase [Rossellomorea aquimaris]|uniref:SunS family peptide S-glycosyltransferase n=1 Tax=Rossellomorea aquimaris TaxID=189382 RepID=UPI001CD6CFB2|nr:SunS family peptide S-glycosyltransferase [Rossellomorea aquimaris]MCA1060834.1 SunS family peptide S-glycosyltransferase [Rossellomorea aquimaris]
MVLLHDLVNLVRRDFPSSKLSGDLEMIEKTNNISTTEVNMNLNDIHIYVTHYEVGEEPSVTCGILTYNEERSISRCIKSIENEFDEIIVLDSYSQDDTKQIIEKHFTKVKLIQAEWNNNFSYSRNKLIDISNSDFIFFIDADNYLDEKSKYKIKRVAKLVSYLNLKCVISPIIIEHNGHIYTDNRKMFLTNNSIYFKGKVHEEPFINGGVVPLNITADIVIHHDGYDPQFVNQDTKNSRNIALTQEMINIEPESPKWHYFYARELLREKGSLDKVVYHLKTSLELYKKQENKYFRYQDEALVLMCKVLYNAGKIKQLMGYINELETLNEHCIDVDYFRGLILLTDIRRRVESIVSSLRIEEVSNKFSYINSRNEHIHMLLGQLYSYLDNWEMVTESYENVHSNHLKVQIISNFNQISKNINKYREKV